MKYSLLFFLLLSCNGLIAQKFALLDEQFNRPIKYTNTITPVDKYDHLFPVEKKMLPEFIKTLKKIEKMLSSNRLFGTATQYKVGCVTFTGRVSSLEIGERIDYFINSGCDNINITMHLSTAKVSNESNAFFIRTWIEYIENNLK